MHAQMVTHLCIDHGCLTSVIWPCTLTSLIVGSRLYYAQLRHLTMGLYYPSVKKQHLHNKHDTKVRVNDQITEVKQPVAYNTKVGDHLCMHLVPFQFSSDKLKF